MNRNKEQTPNIMGGAAESGKVNKAGQVVESHWGTTFERAVKEGSSGEVTSEYNP